MPLSLQKGYWSGASGGGSSDPYWSDVDFALIGNEANSGDYITSSGPTASTLYIPNSGSYSHSPTGGPFSQGSYSFVAGAYPSYNSGFTTNSGSPTYDSTSMTDESTWTMEYWIKHSSSAPHPGTGAWIGPQDGARIIFGHGGTPPNWDVYFGGYVTTTITGGNTTTWTQIAFVRNSSDFYIYVDGTRVQNITPTFLTYVNNLTIMNTHDYIAGVYGEIAGIRLSRIARYTDTTYSAAEGGMPSTWSSAIQLYGA